MNAPAQLTFVSNLFTSKIFLAQVATLIASILSAAGVHVLDDQVAQQQLILVLDTLATVALRYWGSSGSVSLSAPISTPAARDVPVGASVVTVAAPRDLTQATAVQPLPIGVHTVAVDPPAQVGQATPANVTVSTSTP